MNFDEFDYLISHVPIHDGYENIESQMSQTSLWLL